MDSSALSSPRSLNEAALKQFIYQPIPPNIISHLADVASGVIRCEPALHHLSKTCQNPTMHASLAPGSRFPLPAPIDDSDLPSLTDFIATLVVWSKTPLATLMVAVVYLNRLKSRLRSTAYGCRSTVHRVLLASLIVASKYLNDESPLNKHWANYSTINTANFSFGFTLADVNLMEIQLLSLLNWDLRITSEDLYREFEPFLAPIRVHIQWRDVRQLVTRAIHPVPPAGWYGPAAPRLIKSSRRTKRRVKGAGSCIQESAPGANCGGE